MSTTNTATATATLTLAEHLADEWGDLAVVEIRGRFLIPAAATGRMDALTAWERATIAVYLGLGEESLVMLRNSPAVRHLGGGYFDLAVGAVVPNPEGSNAAALDDYLDRLLVEMGADRRAAWLAWAPQAHENRFAQAARSVPFGSAPTSRAGVAPVGSARHT